MSVQGLNYGLDRTSTLACYTELSPDRFREFWATERRPCRRDVQRSHGTAKTYAATSITMAVPQTRLVIIKVISGIPSIAAKARVGSTATKKRRLDLCADGGFDFLVEPHLTATVSGMGGLKTKPPAA